MSGIGGNICSQCGGFKTIWYKVEVFTAEDVKQGKTAPSSVSKKPFPLCPGHPEPVPKHDGQLNKEGTHNVYPNNFNGVGISGEGGAIGLSAQEALSLLAWLKQEEANLQTLAEEEKKQ